MPTPQTSVESETTPIYCAPPANMAQFKQEGEDRVIERAIQILDSRIKDLDAITSPDTVRDYLRLKMSGLKNEVFSVLFLNNRHKVLQYEEMFQGTIDGASVYPRVIAQRALEVNAAAVILAHNHPSGDTTPSTADKQMTHKVLEALKLFDIRTLDHCIVGNDIYSLAEHGQLDAPRKPEPHTTTFT